MEGLIFGILRYFRDVVIYDDVCVLYGNNIDIKLLM